MNNLILANLMRLKKSKIFWGIAAFMAMLGFFFAFMKKQVRDSGMDATLESGAFQYVALVGIVIAVFCAVFPGTEDADGTLRNKIIAGHQRWEIYLSTFVVCSLTSMFFCLIHMVCYLGLGAVLLGGFGEAVWAMVIFAGCALMLSVCFSAIFTLVVLLCHNKAASAVACILLALLLLFAGSYIKGLLDEPEVYGGYYMDETGTLQNAEPEPNPRYISGTTRDVYTFLLDATPGGQQIQVSTMENDKPWLLAGYSSVISVAVTALGIALFRKKELK